MRILVVGAGATGGYFGGRLLEAGRDVRFLVRPRRATQLAEHGLRLRSPYGDADLVAPTVTADAIEGPYDLVLLSCKAYHLDPVIEDIAPAVGPHTAILPLLNGMRHLDRLDARFGRERVLGGLCVIAGTLDGEGRILHLNRMHGLAFGERDGTRSARVEAIRAHMEGARFDARASEHIAQDMWDKWVFLATLAGITCLMRAPIGAIAAAPGGEQAVLGLLDDCRRVAAEAGHAPREAVLANARTVLTEAGSPLTASMLRDLEHGDPIEADQIIGDLIERAGTQREAIPLLRLAYAHLKAYEARRAGE
ncbi:2-dehydropantoate 2-reductase [Frateuria defendens]|uniref:2-dehydropantoate 2-reductase n=1 Tax=Frateuria defendens TaxID=2219559 RepID=UPI00066FD9CC|nr:2-dehydropantoate 2-reductase [Frateuria defendens]